MFRFHSLLLIFLSLTLVAATHAQTLTVQSLATTIDGSDGILTLPEAVRNANTIPGEDLIIFEEGLSGTITFTSDLQVSESVEIRGPGRDVLTLSFPLYGVEFDFEEAALDVVIKGLKFRGYGIVNSRAENLHFEDCSFEGIEWRIGRFYVGDTLTFTNVHMLQGSPYIDLKPPEGGSGIVVFESVLIDGAGLGVSDWASYSGSLNTIFRRSRFSGSSASLTLRDLTFDQVVADNNTLFSTQTIGGKIDIVNSLFLNNEQMAVRTTASRSDGEIVSITDANIEHSTFFGNGAYSSYGMLDVSDGTLVIDHSVLGGMQDGVAIIHNNSTVSLTYSLLDSILNETGSEASYDDVSLGLLTAFPEFTETYEGISPTLVALVPAAGGNLVDAGDAEAVAGDTVPETDLPGSERIIGEAPDLGAVERNLPPVLDVDALKQEIRDQIAASPEATVHVDLENFASDPDGDLIDDIRVEDAETGLSFDDETWILSGEPDDIKVPELTIILVDQHGLEGGAVLAARRVSSGGGGGGVISHAFLILLSLMMFARTSRIGRR